MSQRIQVLDPQVANKIAAGEVVERPSAVVKELVENAIDAGATKIHVEIATGGKKLIRITDNGSGITPEDMVIAFERHATSKVRAIEDIYALETLGFRGEALASIAAVSHVEMISKVAEQATGQVVKISGGKLVETSAVGSETGTTMVVKELFYNTPARLKFMKSTAAETSAISDLMIRLALSHTEISFSYIADQKIVFKTSGDGDLKKVIYAVLDKEFATQMLPVDVSEKDWKIKGFMSKLSFTKGNRAQQIFFVNQRFVKSKHLLDAVAGAYLGQLPVGRFPSAVLFIELPPEQIDVNIHPAKTEIKFHNEFALKDEWLLALRAAIRDIDQIPEIKGIKHSYQEPPVKVASPVVKEEPLEDFEPLVDVRPQRVNTPVHNGQAMYQQVHTPMKNPVVPAIPSSFKPEHLSKLKMEDLSTEKPHVMPEPLYEQTSLIQTSESLYDDLLYIGQVFNSYLLFQKEGKLFVIDQHAGHEKILYETFRKSFEEENHNRQVLARPIIISVNHAQLMALQDAKEEIQRLGFEFEPFGDDAIVVREVPLAFISTGTEGFFRSVLEVSDKRQSAGDLFKEKLITAACKAAIKANDRMEAFEVKKLLADLKTLKDPYTCPHGRPIIVNITQSEFEKMFKRT